jgi:hypothetical protein
MPSPVRRFVPIVIAIGFILRAADGHAQVASYIFSGHLEVSTNLPGGDSRQGLPFTAQLAYSIASPDYSGDWQTSNPNFGEYTSSAGAVSLELHYVGADYFDSSGSPVSSIEIWNNSGLFYNNGVPRFTGDQFGIWHYTILPQTFGDPGNLWTVDEQVLLKFSASDTSGIVFNNDSIRTAVDFSQFDDLRIQIVPVVPVSGSDPPSPYYDRIEAVIDTVQVVPEPTSASLAVIAAVSLLRLKLSKRG